LLEMARTHRPWSWRSRRDAALRSGNWRVILILAASAAEDTHTMQPAAGRPGSMEWQFCP
jgi:hypothetical protein